MSAVRIAFTVSCLIWLVFELWLNYRDRRKVDAVGDKNSGIYLFYLIVGAVFIAGIVQYSDLPRIPVGNDLRLLVSTFIILSGAGLRWWAVWYLGKYFRTVVVVRDGQKVVEQGPYRFIRHPAYAGALLVFVGFGLGLGSWLGLGVMFVFPLSGYLHRIKLEEQFMIRCFQKEYVSFIGRTKKLIPFIY